MSIHFRKSVYEKRGLSMNILILTSTSVRHDYLICKLSETFNVIAAIKEDKGDYYQQESEDIRQHMNNFTITENNYFKPDKNILSLLKENTLNINKNEINSEYILNWIKAKEVDLIVVFGTSIIRDPLLNAFKNKLINLHMGLSPYYKGSATNFWPLVNNELQCVGGTIHLINSKVDEGPILYQVRPDIEEGDNCHLIGCKTIQKTIDELPLVIEKYVQGKIIPQVQLTEGMIYRKRDFNPESVLKMQENFVNGIVNKYLINKKNIDEQFPIFNNNCNI